MITEKKPYSFHKELYEDCVKIEKIAGELGYMQRDVMLFTYIHRKVVESGKDAGYFRGGPRHDQACDIWEIGKNLRMGMSNDLHLVIERVNSEIPRLRDCAEAQEIAELYAKARERGVTNPDLYLSRLMLFFDTKSTVSDALDAYESEILPILSHIKSRNAMVANEGTKTGG